MSDETPVSAAPAATQTQSALPLEAPVSAQPTPSPSAEVSSAPVTSTSEPTVLGAADATPSEVKTDEAPTEAKIEEKVKTEIKTDSTEAKSETKVVEPDKKIEDGAPKQPESKEKETSSQSDEPAPLPTFEPWKFPEGVQVDETRVGEFNKELAEFARDAKVEAKLVQGLGQKLIERHVSEIQSVAKTVAEAYNKVWTDQTKSWYEQFVKDPEIGGNRQETTTAAAREFIRKHGGTDEQQAEIRTLMQQTGIGNHPAVIRLFAKANANLAEGKPVIASKPPSAPQSMKQKFYGKKS